MNAWIFILIALGYAVMKVWLERRWASQDAVGDAHELANLAFSSGQSVYALFQAAGTKWNVAPKQVDNDFKQYLTDGQIPHYMRDDLRRHISNGDRTYLQLIFAGGRPPYL